MTLFSTLQDLEAGLNAELSDILTSREMPLYQMMSYHMGWADRHGAPDTPKSTDRTHGLLCLLTCRAVGGDAEAALPAAAALELANNFCQIHDDVQSGSPQRDHRDTVWWVWGPAQAINTGDGMHAMARLALFRMLRGGVSSQMTFSAIRLLDDACLRLCEGKFLDLEAQERIDTSVESYLEMVESKAGEPWSRAPCNLAPWSAVGMRRPLRHWVLVGPGLAPLCSCAPTSGRCGAMGQGRPRWPPAPS